MYRILVVDDEELLLQSMQMLIARNFPEISEVYLAGSGLEAIELAEIHKPDIVFIDIKMPGISGLEAIKEIKKKNPHIKFIVISAYEQFNFARESIELGVYDYILKPVNKNKILEVVQKTLDLIQSEREKQLQDLKYRAKFEKTIPYLESQFLFNMIFYTDKRIVLKDYETILNISMDQGFIVIVELENPAILNKSSGRILKFYEILRDSAKSITSCLVSSIMMNRFVLFIPQPDAYENRKDEYAAIIDICSRIKSAVNSGEKFDFKIGIGSMFYSKDYIYNSYEEALKAVRFAGNGEIITIRDISCSDNPSSYPVILEKELLENLSLCNAEKCKDNFNAIFNWFTANHQDSFEKIKIGLVQLLVMMYRSVSESAIDESSEVFGNQEYLMQYFKIADPNEMVLFFHNKIMQFNEMIEKSKEQKIDNIFTEVKNYISQNMAKDIKLDDVAKIVCLSPSYFSTIFHKTTGTNFIDYLNQMRLNKAKQMIKQTDKSIKEIAIDVGYSNPNYFSRVFKNYIGMTPSEYKETP